MTRRPQAALGDAARVECCLLGHHRCFLGDRCGDLGRIGRIGECGTCLRRGHQVAAPVRDLVAEAIARAEHGGDRRGTGPQRDEAGWDFLCLAGGFRRRGLGCGGWRGLGSGRPGGLRGNGLRLAEVAQCRCVGASGGERTAAQPHRGIVGDAGAGGAGKVVHGGLGGGDRDGGELGLGRITRIERGEQLSRGVLVLVGVGAGHGSIERLHQLRDEVGRGLSWVASGACGRVIQGSACPSRSLPPRAMQREGSYEHSMNAGLISDRDTNDFSACQSEDVRWLGEAQP